MTMGYRKKRRGFQRRKVCQFCVNKTMIIDYKSPEILRKFVSERGRIVPRRISGVCAKHQRALTVEIKRARILALLPFTTANMI